MIQEPLALTAETKRVLGSSVTGPSLRVAGLFAGIGGIELGLEQAGHETALLCEIDEAARAVLKANLAAESYPEDVKTLHSLPKVQLLTAGFPCQDLSISGQRSGIGGSRSGLVEHVFRLIDLACEDLRWVLLENVPFVLRLQNGRGMEYLIGELEARGFRWAYRIVDTRAFGLPHRRERLLLLASKTEDPRDPLLSADSTGPALAGTPSQLAACGFYWTEGRRGIGWSEDTVPPIKVGSGLGIPSSPAIWDPTAHSISMPDIRDIERLQGFEAGWTEPAGRAGHRNARYGLIGNSVSVPLAKWIGEQLRSCRPYDCTHDWKLPERAKWPEAAWGGAGVRFSSSASKWPVANQLPSLLNFLKYPGRSLSPRAAAGLLTRLQRSRTRVPEAFLADLSALASSLVSDDDPEQVPQASAS